MNEHNKYNADCPDDFELVAYKEGNLSVEDRQDMTEHLLLCERCLLQLELLPWNTVEEMKAAIAEDDSELDVSKISPILTRAFDIYRKKQLAEPKADSRSLKAMLAKDGLEVGQIWRTKLENISVPLVDGEERTSVSKLGSVPHLVVITNTSVETQMLSSKNYRLIKVMPVDDNFHYAREMDVVFDEKESPLGYAFSLQVWNQQEILSENLDTCLGMIEVSPSSFEGQDILSFLRKMGTESVSNADFSLFGIIEKGLYSDPAMRHRARAFEKTSYLRVPVQELRQSLSILMESKMQKESAVKAESKKAEKPKRKIFETLRGTWGDLREKLTFDLGFMLNSQPGFESSFKTLRFQTEDELCQIAVYEEKNHDIAIRISSKEESLVNREVALFEVTEDSKNITELDRERLVPFDKGWISAKFLIKKKKRKKLLEEGKLQIDFVQEDTNYK